MEWYGTSSVNAEYRHTSSAIYHQFDVETGRALWIITGPLQPRRQEGAYNPLWAEVHNNLRYSRYSIASDCADERFAASLDILTHLAEWCIGDGAYYLHNMDQRLEEIVSYHNQRVLRTSRKAPGLIQQVRVANICTHLAVATAMARKLSSAS
jgi:hypothetical protein